MSTLDQWEAETKNKYSQYKDSDGPLFLPKDLKKDQFRILALIGLVRKITQIKPRHSCPSCDLESSAYSDGFNEYLNQALALTEELK